LVDLVEELFEAFVFGDPCADLREQIFGDIDRPGLVARTFEGEVLTGMEGTTVMTPARRSSAAVGVGVQGGGQDRRGGDQLFEPAVEHAADQGGVFRNAHERPKTGGREKGVCRLSGKTRKSPGAKKEDGGQRKR
jgi:hypothetical protein